ncbi:MAG: NAAT family transporter [Chlamydiae bacterium]|nr:NAAT family transporter [Chlamydiota bacterium]
MEVTYFINYFVTMLVVCNPLIAIPVLLNLTQGRTKEQRHSIGIWSGISLAVILVLVTLIGGPILDFLGVRIAAFQCAGGIIVFLIALSMLNAEVSPMRQNLNESHYKPPNISVVPLAIPIMAGPGAFSAAIIASRAYSSVFDLLILSLCGLGVGVIAAIILYFAAPIETKLGSTGINIVTRVGGLILASLSVEIFFRGLASLGVL